ncbi:MAG: hypothetical protein GKS03_09020 [Alphaproteobacteria bacterium]|nr:hypothetical protein [Alphaproteobacteria bacterium]
MIDSIVEKPNALALTQINLADVGLDQIAYIRPVVIDDKPSWSIYNAAGEVVGAAPSREQAMAAILQNDLTPHFVN